MTPACPQCGTSDHTAPVPQMYADATVAPQARALLAPPPPPVPPAVRQSTAATVFCSLAGAAGLLGLVTEVRNSSADLSGTTEAYQFGYAIGPFVLPVILLAVAMTLRTRSLERARRAAEQAGYAQQTRWQALQRVWQSGWLCRTCGVAFLPAGAAGPASGPSPAVAPAQYHLWVAAAVDRGHP